jgi:hypothetical protein
MGIQLFSAAKLMALAIVFAIWFTNSAQAAVTSDLLPPRFTSLNDYVIPAPNQGPTNTCLFQAATGAMEILLNKSLNNKSPKVNGDTDISERYTISEDASRRSKTWFENAFLKFDSGEAILNRTIPFNAFSRTGNIMNSVWNIPGNMDNSPRIRLPAVDTVYLFSLGDGRWSRNVLTERHVEMVKDALIRYESPIILVGNDEDYWHVTVVTGYDDDINGDCYELESGSCREKGAFYVRDSFGLGLETRSYDWFMRRNNSAAVAKLR